jgi:phosphoserine aminotransferase
MARAFNFSAGPAILPLSVLEKAAGEFVDYAGKGMSLIEMSHRGKEYDKVHAEATALLKEILGIPEGYKVLFLGGGATMQFGMIPMNLLPAGKSADYVNTGAWGQKAIEDAQRIGKVRVVWDGKAEKYMRWPKLSELKWDENAAYAHITTNETIGGIENWEWPDTGKVPLVADMSSDFLSRPVPVEKFGLIYAGAQKNVGPAGVTIVIIREDLAMASPNLPIYLQYKTHYENDSLYNTPPVFSIYMVKLVLEWLKAAGGLPAMAELAKKRAAVVYNAIDGSGGYYRCPVATESRSLMNIVWRLPSEALEEKFLKEAGEKKLLQLKGHRSVGGCRASVYNAMPMEGVQALTAFMAEFQKNNPAV